MFNYLASFWNRNTVSKAECGKLYEAFKKQISVYGGNNNICTASAWYKVGNKHFTGQTKEGSIDYFYARICFEIGLEIDESNADIHYGLGQIYHYGHKVERDLETAKKLYQEALSIDCSHESAMRQLLLIEAERKIKEKEEGTSDASVWTSLGHFYHEQKSYIQARICFEEGLKAEGTCKELHYNLGIIYEFGRGVERDTVKAKKYYQDTLDVNENYKNPKRQLLLIEAEEKNISTASEWNNTASEWNNLGVKYYDGQDGREQDYVRARICYKEALKKKDAREYFYCMKNNLGELYLHGHGVGKNLEKAKKHFSDALESKKDFEPAIRGILLVEQEEANKTTAVEWNKRGCEYRKGKDYIRARICFEEGLKAEGTCKKLHYNLGRIYEYGEGVERDIVKAKKYYQDALDVNENYEPAIRRLLLIEAEEMAKKDPVLFGALTLDRLGRQYQNRKDYTRARMCYEEGLRLDSNAKCLHFRLGILYFQALGVPKNVKEANEQFLAELKVDPDCEYTKKQLLLIEAERKIKEKEEGTSDASVWTNLGHFYYEQKAYMQARICFEEGLKAEGTCKELRYNLGIIYEYGRGGVSKNIEEAKKQYQLALEIDPNYKSAIRGLLAIVAQKEGIETAMEWNNLGVDYFIGQRGKERNYYLARTCSEKAFELDNNQEEANLNLGEVYLRGLGASQDLDKAMMYLVKAGVIPAFRKHCRDLWRLLIENLQRNGDLDKQDSDGNTVMHHMVTLGFYKHCAMLMNLEADSNMPNSRNRTANQMLEDRDASGALKEIAVQKLRNCLGTRSVDYKTSTVRAIMNRLRVNGYYGVDDATTKAALEDLYARDYCRPILELIKLACLAWNDRAKRRRFTNDGYDSDDDYKEETSDEMYFTIHIDPDRDETDRYCGMKDAVGFSWSPIQSVFLAGCRTKEEVRGTLVHELTHFAALETFGNDSNPFRKDDKKAEKRFSEICDELRGRKSELPFIIQDAFLDSYEEKKQVHGELIVRVIQTAYRNGVSEVERTVPELWKYYREEFLPAIKQHVSRLEARMLGGWSPGIFENPKSKSFSLERTNDSDVRCRNDQNRARP